MDDVFRLFLLFLNSRYISYGLRMTLGVTVPAVVLAGQDLFVSGITASLGALCVGISDVPGTLSRKRNGMVIGGVLMFLVSFLTGLATASTFLLFGRSEEHTSELQSLMRISYAVFCLKT